MSSQKHKLVFSRRFAKLSAFEYFLALRFENFWGSTTVNWHFQMSSGPSQVVDFCCLVGRCSQHGHVPGGTHDPHLAHSLRLRLPPPHIRPALRPGSFILMFLCLLFSRRFSFKGKMPDYSSDLFFFRLRSSH